jgi:hypothetical protein
MKMPATGVGTRGQWLGLWLVPVTVVYLTLTSTNLANYRPISGDDGWILSASHKLAMEGVFGSDLYAGFFGADRHYFVSLPGIHVLQAVALQLPGDGLLNARWVSVGSGALLLWTASILAWRWHGLLAGFLTSLLLVSWQPALVGPEGVPLVSLSRSLRYDLPAVTWTWITLFFLEKLLRSPSAGRALAAGVCAATAALTQFFGAVAVLVLVVAWSGQQRRGLFSNPHTRWLLAGFVLIAGPYLLYVALHWPDALGQTLYIKGERAAFTLPALLDNVWREPVRYRALLHPADLYGWANLAGVAAAVAYLGLRLSRGPTAGDRVLALTLGATLLFLAVVDTTKAELYALPLLPVFCVVLARLLADLWQGARPAAWKWANRTTVVAGLAFILWQGARFYHQDQQLARTVSDYHALGAAIEAAIPEGARVAGSERWWWPLRQHAYLALNSLSLQWHVRGDENETPPRYDLLMAEARIDYILLSRNVQGDMAREPSALQGEFWAFISTCTTVEAEWDDPWYGQITLLAIRKDCRFAQAGSEHTGGSSISMPISAVPATGKR